MARFALAIFCNMAQNQGVSDVWWVDMRPPLGVHMRHARFAMKGIWENSQNLFLFNKLPIQPRNIMAAKRVCVVYKF